MNSPTNQFWRTSVILTLSTCLFLSCNKESLNEEASEVIKEDVIVEDSTLHEGAENTVTIKGKTYSLSKGTFDDWGLEYPGSRQFSLDLYSGNYDPFAESGVSFGVYLNSPSLDSFTYGTYSFLEEETTPGGIMIGSIYFNGAWFHLVSGWISIEQEGEKYRIKWEMVNSKVESQQDKVSGHYFGPLTYWSVDD